MVASARPEGYLHRLFYTPVLEFDFGPGGLPDVLAQTIQDRRKEHPGLKRSNALGWHSDTEMLQWGGKPAIVLAHKVMEIATSHTSDRGKQGESHRFQLSMEMWANVSPPGASNHVHAHPNAFWSAVFFVADGGAKDDGHLVLLDPRFPMAQMYNSDLFVVDEHRQAQDTAHRIRPQPGKLVLFPSWLLHYVEPHAGTGDRISIAMNITVRQSEA